MLVQVSFYSQIPLIIAEGEIVYKMDFGNICFCKRCGTIDYADGKCPKCGSMEIVEANIDFLMFGNVIRDATKFSENIDYCAESI